MKRARLRAIASYFIVCTGLMMFIPWVRPPVVGAEVLETPTATVEAVEGEARVFAESQEQPVLLAPGVNVPAWNTISTGTQTRLFLNWNIGIITSVGDMSSLFVSVEKRPDRNIAQFQVIEGIVRVATREGPGIEVPYAVLTPAAAIQPENFIDPADIIVESYDPSTTAVTVLSGRVRVSTGGEGGSTAKTISACETAYVDQAKKTIDVARISSGDVAQLVAASTLPDTIGLHPGECTMAAELAPVQPPPLASTYYPRDDYYYFEDSDPPDFAAYDDITVLPPRAGIGCSILVPGIGQFTIPYAALGNWACDPIVVLPFARRVFFDRCLLRYQDYWRDLWWRRNELHRILYLAQIGGNRSLLWQARHELDYLKVRIHWVDRRVHGMEGRIASLEQQEQGVRGRLPQGLNLHQAIADGLLSPTNVHSLERFQKKLKNDLEVQNRLANIAGEEAVQMRSRLGHERDAQKRLALREGLVRFNGDVAQGKLPIPTKKREFTELYGQLGKERDPGRQERLEGQLLDQLGKAQASPVPDVLEPGRLTSLQKDLAQFPNPEKRGDLEKRLTDIQQSLATRREAEAGRSNVEGIASQAAREKNPQKQQELLGRLKDLSVPLAIGGLGAVGVQQLRQQQQHVQLQITGETDQAKKATLQKTLEELRQRETGLQQLEQYRKGRSQDIKPGEEQRKQPQLQLRQPQSPQQQSEEPRQQLQQRKLDQLQRGNQLDRLKQQEQFRLQQPKERETDVQRLQQEERVKKDEETRRQQQLQQERVRQDELRKQQEGSRIQQLQKEQEKRRQEQMRQQERSPLPQLRKDEEPSRQLQLRQQQEQQRLQQEQTRQQQLKQNQERARQQQQQQEKSRQEQLRLQQERGRQEQLRLQQDRSRQEQMKLQQERSQQQQLKQQQDRARQEQQRQQQEQSRQQAIRQQQEQARQQQQERARQEQLRLQKLKEDAEKKLR